MNDAPQELDVVIAARRRDLPVLRLAIAGLREYVACDDIRVIVPARDTRSFRRGLGSDVTILDEDQYIPGMTKAELGRLPLALFPRAAGWYYQQFLKLQPCFEDGGSDYYLVWDADTIPLRPLRFFDGKGRMLLTKATEHHPPYFDTYRKILGEDAERQFSFIAQHMVVQKSIAREMLLKVEATVAGDRSWAWKIMSVLPPTGFSLFSEYETLGHYAMQHYPDRVVCIDRPWHRENGGLPSPEALRELGQTYDFASFESGREGWRRFATCLLKRLRRRRAAPC